MHFRSYSWTAALAAGLAVSLGGTAAAHATTVPPTAGGRAPTAHRTTSSSVHRTTPSAVHRTTPSAVDRTTPDAVLNAAPGEAPGVTSTVPSTGRIVARYGFDGTRSAIGQDQSGQGHNLTIVTSHGGTVRTIKHGSGQALYFPAPCTVKKAKTCAHVALRSPSSADLNPGTAPISYGASVQLTAGRTSKGQNVVQKGYSATSSQYKLQVDGKRGHPSCVVVDDKKPGIQFVRSTVTVADGTWHSITCKRIGTVLSVLVDGKLRGVKAIPATLSITNPEPLAIGGKGAYQDNDQFQGALDDVWVRIG